jgi:hypothetical protein
MQVWTTRIWAYHTFTKLSQNLHILIKGSFLCSDNFVGGGYFFWVGLFSSVTSYKKKTWRRTRNANANGIPYQ